MGPFACDWHGLKAEASQPQTQTEARTDYRWNDPYREEAWRAGDRPEDRAIQNAPTHSAPAAFKAREDSETEVPVVNTSSTINILRGGGSRALIAPLITSRRCSGSSFTCCGVSRIFLSASKHGTPVIWEIEAAMRAAWSKPLSRVRLSLEGTHPMA